MDVPTFEGNSLKGRNNRGIEEKRPVLSPVINKKAVKVKNKYNLISILYNDPNKPFKDFLIKDLIIPNVLRTTGTIMHQIITKLFGGGPFYGGGYTYTNGWFNNNNNNYGIPMANYNNAQRSPTIPGASPRPQQTTATTDLKSYVLQTKEDAECVLEGLCAYIDTYDIVPVSAFFELIGVQAPYTYHDFGWISLANAKVVPMENGWSINLPKPVRIR